MTDHAHVFRETTRGGFEVMNSQSSLEIEDKVPAIQRHGHFQLTTHGHFHQC